MPLELSQQDIRWATRWARGHCRKRGVSAEDTLDIVQDALLALVVCARSFDPEVGTSFRKYAACRVWGAFRDTARKWRGRTTRHQQGPTYFDIQAISALEERVSPAWRAPPRRPHRTLGPRVSRGANA